MKRLLYLLLGVLALLSATGCSKDEGTMVTDADRAKLLQKQLDSTEKQIADIQNNPNMPPQVKAQAIANIRAGAARASSGAQAGQAQGKKK